MTIIQILLVLSFATLSAFASTPGDSTKTYVLDPVVVTASQIEVLRSTVPNSVSILSKMDLHGSGETSVLRTINEKVPGVFVTERGILGYGVSTGAAGGITIRGAGGSPNTEVLVLTDGRPQLMGLMGHPLPDTYVNSGIERVEIIRGPASILHGTNAMGGVINLIRERASMDGFSGRAGASYGSFDTRKFEGGLDYGSENAGIGIDGNYYETSGQRSYSSFKENNGTVRGWAKLSDVFLFSADANITGFRAFDPGPTRAPAINQWVDITRGSSGFSIENRFKNVQGAFKAFYNWGIHDIYDGFHSTDNNIGVLLYEGLKPIQGNLTTLGLDYERYGGKANSGPADFGEHFVSESAVYLLTQQDIFANVNASAGVRVNNHSLYGVEITPQFGLTLQLDPQTTVKVLTGKGFRSPTIRELYLFPAPTPTLGPERMWDYEASVLRSFADGLASIEITAFVSEGTNQIRVLGAFPKLTLANSGSFTHHGVEFAGTIRPRAHLSIDVTYSYLERGDQTAASPKHKLYLGAWYAVAPITYNVGFQYVSGLFGADYSNQPLPDYSNVNARVTVQVADGLSAYLAGENLLDRPYQTIFQYPMPGRTGFIGLNWNIQ